MTLGPRCKHCRMLKQWMDAKDLPGDCPENPTKEHEFIEPEYDATPSPGVPDPPSDPVGRLIWDLQYAVTEVPPLDPVPTCTRSLALATAYQAQASGRQAAALERIATALERVMEETDPIPPPPTMPEWDLCPVCHGGCELPSPAGGPYINCEKCDGRGKVRSAKRARLKWVMEETDPIRVPTMAELTERGRGVWRVGGKVPVNVYEGDRPVCQCHSEEDAQSIVEAMNRAIPTIPTACEACGRIRLITGACSGCGQMAADCRCSSETGARA